ncbi:hypothetical protein SDC9_92299 [bioreactor metagenome]|uniref:Uncharacterized protein n=1 Tax=bioreactor metagenome TaxID=1076179 RepID=A0A645A057_9ZZZZ
MIESAVTDVVCPTVAAKHPNGLLDEQVFVIQQFAGELAGVAGADLAVLDPFRFPLGAGHVEAVLRGGDQTICRFAGTGCVVFLVEPVLCGGPEVVRRVLGCDHLVDDIDHAVSALRVGKHHTKTELCVVFKQRVGPSGAAALVVDRVGAGRRAAAVDGGAARCVGNDHAVAE